MLRSLSFILGEAILGVGRKTWKTENLDSSAR